MFDAVLFTWLQGAEFYRELHADAVASLPRSDGALWIDAGCGPGLVARLAAARGYRVQAFDRSPAMVRTARRLAGRSSLEVEFSVGDVAQLPAHAADVVSAASLLAVLPDKPGGLTRLWQAVRPGGHLLVVEPTMAMNPRAAQRLIASGRIGHRSVALRMWAAARQNRAVDPAIFEDIEPLETRIRPLLDGMVEARLFRKTTRTVKDEHK